MFLSLLLFCCFASAAHAEALCARYPEELSEADIDRVRSQLIMLAPVRHAELAHRVRIVNDRDSDEMAPYFTPAENGAPPTIHIPRHFRRMQCQMVQFAHHYQYGNLPLDMEVDPVMQRCMAMGFTAQGCVIGMFNAAAELLEANRTLPELWLTMIGEATEAGFLFDMLHEFAHLAMRHRPSGDANVEARQEAEADSFALLRSITGNSSGKGAFSTFAALALFDRYFSQNSGHGRFSCRAAITDDVMNALEIPAHVVHGWVGHTPAEYRAARLAAPGPREGRFRIPGGATGCANGRTAGVTAIERDLQVLATRLDALARAGESDPPLPAMAETLLGLPLATEEVRSFRMTLISVKLRNANMTGVLAANRAENLALINRLLAGRDVPHLMSQDYARLLGLSALLTFGGGPPGSRLDAMIAAARPQLQRAVYYGPDLLVFHLNLGAMDYMVGECATGRQHYLRVVTLERHPNAEMRPMIEPYLVEMDAAACARARDELRESIRTPRGWRD